MSPLNESFLSFDKNINSSAQNLSSSIYNITADAYNTTNYTPAMNDYELKSSWAMAWFLLPLAIIMLGCSVIHYISYKRAERFEKQHKLNYGHINEYACFRLNENTGVASRYQDTSLTNHRERRFLTHPDSERTRNTTQNQYTYTSFNDHTLVYANESSNYGKISERTYAATHSTAVTTRAYDMLTFDENYGGAIVPNPTTIHLAYKNQSNNESEALIQSDENEFESDSTTVYTQANIHQSNIKHTLVNSESDESLNNQIYAPMPVAADIKYTLVNSESDESLNSQYMFSC